MKFNLDLVKISSRVTPLLMYLEKKREDQKIARYVEIGSTFFLISFFILFAIKPTFLTISSLLGDIKSKEILTKQLKSKINDVIVAQDIFSQAQERYALVESSLPINPRFFQANSQIINVAAKNTIALAGADYSIKDSNYFSTSINTITSYQSAVGFISEILQNRRLIDLNGFSFSINEDIPNQININLPLKIYFWKDDAKK
ncbi:MAG: hypothetical protein WC503_01670 [Candidatus Shapirobacteria bacterium]